MPVNMASHAHDQGYMDLNFLIPELVGGVKYRKGVYAAEDGDFVTAGSARIDCLRHHSGWLRSIGQRSCPMSLIELDDHERQALVEVLQSFLSELRNEVTHTDRQEFRQRLKDQEHLLRKILGKIDQP